MAVKFPLEMKDGVQVRNIAELKENFDVEKVVGYFLDGKLKKWLDARWYEDESEAISNLNQSDPLLARHLCEIFGVAYVENKINIEEIDAKNARISKLKQFTDDLEILTNIDCVAFNQEELAELYEQGKETIYLCEGKFKIPQSKMKLKYKIIGDAIVEGLTKDFIFPYDLAYIKKGNIIEFGESDYKRIKWLILDESIHGFLVILLDDNIPTLYKNVSKTWGISNFGTFDSKNCSKWEASSLRKELNSEFIKLYFNDIEKMCIVDQFHVDVNCSDKVFLLSLDEVFKYQPLLEKYHRFVGWTRTPASEILPRDIFSDNQGVIVPDLKENFLFHWFNNKVECQKYFDVTWRRNPNSQPMLFNMIGLVNAKSFEHVRPVMMLKK